MTSVHCKRMTAFPHETSVGDIGHQKYSTTKYCSTLAEAETIIETHETQNGVRFAAYTTTKGFGTKDLKLGKRIHWKDIACAKFEKQESYGIPFVYLGLKRMDCQFGKDRKKKTKLMRKEKEKEVNDHSYKRGKKYLVQPTKKMDCPASCMIREIIQFTSYKVEGKEEAKKKMFSRQILYRIKCGEELEHRRVFVVYLPNPHDHSAHPVNECPPQPIDTRVSRKIKEMSGHGVKHVVEMKRHLKAYVKDICSTLPHPANKRFYPSDKTISNHMYKHNNTPASFDQETLDDMVNQWKRTRPNDFFYYRKKAETSDLGNESFLFVHIADNQKALIKRYGNSISYLDATYKTTLFDLPLFFVCVKTNVDYQVVASFVVESETTYAIKEALQHLRQQCLDWSPSFFLTDCDESEMSAIEQVFPDCSVIICDFHREQAWERWVRKSEHKIDNQSLVLSWFRKLAKAKTTNEFDMHLEAFQQTSIWKNQYLQRYLMKVWLPLKERWCVAYRREFIPVCAGTNNGLEVHHRVFKRSYLRGKTTFTLSNMLTLLVEEFLPDRYQKYTDLNRQSDSTYRKYNNDVPKFLHGRPRAVVKHCMSRIESVNSKDGVRVQNQSDGIYMVHIGEIVQTVNIGNEETYPSCGCDDWHYTHLPCTHIFAAISEDGSVQWERLPSKYRDSPLMTLDETVTNYAKIRSEDESVNKEEPDEAKENKSTEGKTSINDIGRKTNTVRSLQIVCRSKLQKVVGLTYNIDQRKTLEKMRMSLDELHKEFCPPTTGLQPQIRPLKRRKSFKRYRRRCGIRANLLRKQYKTGVKLDDESVKHNIEIDGTYGVPNVPDIPDPYDVTDISDVSDVEMPSVRKPRTNDESVKHKIEIDGTYGVPDVPDIPDPYDVTDISDVSDVEMPSVRKPGTNRHLVEKLWGLPKDYNIPVAKMYGHQITDTDIRSLRPREWLTDKVLDCYVTITSVDHGDRGKRILPLPQTMVGSIIQNEQPRIREKISEFQYMTGVYHRHAHWTLLFIERFFEGSTLEGIVREDLNLLRAEFAERILMYEHYMEGCCPMCAFAIDDEETIQCATCMRHFHFKPYCVEEDLQDAEDEFKCRLCKIKYWPIKPRTTQEKQPIKWTTKEKVFEQLKGDTDVIVVEKYKKTSRKRKTKRSSSYMYPPLKGWKGETKTMPKEWETNDLPTTESDEEDDEERSIFLITKAVAAEKILSAYERCHSIVQTKSCRSKRDHLVRHNGFAQTLRSAATEGFGFSIFSQQAIMFVDQNVRTNFLVGDPESIYALPSNVLDMGNDRLNTAFKQDRFLAMQYIARVLIKEALVAIMEEVTSCSYSEANAQLKETEGTKRNAAYYKGLNTGMAKKKTYEKKL